LKNKNKTVILAILDGWGHAQSNNQADNAILLANTPNMDSLTRTYPMSFLDASELNVGLPEGQMGNSEVGHMSIGSGRVVMQELPKIDISINKGELAGRSAIVNLISSTKASGGKVHVMGLLSPGGVHSHQRHFAEVIKIICQSGLETCAHLFLDGRDTPPSSALEYLSEFSQELKSTKGFTIATVSGRYYAMDRDKRWERVEQAYKAISAADAPNFADAESAIQAAYAEKITDEFIKPAAIGDYHGMKDGDSIIFINFRADRARQILQAFLLPDFSGFARRAAIKFTDAVGMVEYSEELAGYMHSIFQQEKLSGLLGEAIAKNGMKQLRIAETEKYPHVTYFFNGGLEQEYTGEKRILVASPKVATYDLQPEMSAPEVTDKLIAELKTGTYDLIVVNYANTDMVGHTGNLQAAIKAVEAVDECIGRITQSLFAMNGIIIITADHGNAEMMMDEQTGQEHTAHTLNRVPFIVAGNGFEKEQVTLRNGILADVAPTILNIMGLEIPEQMTGETLVRKI